MNIKKISFALLITTLIALNFSNNKSSFSFGNYTVTSLFSLKMKVASAIENNTPPPTGVGTFPNCQALGNPWNGNKSGYWWYGNRKEDTESWFKAVDLGVNPHVSFGLFESAALAQFAIKNAINGSIERLITVAYTCDENNQKCCAIVDRYVLE